jgi:putative transposase
LSASRYHAWQRQSPCGPDDVASCPRSWPHQLTQEEVETIKRFVTSKEYRHVPTGTLALLAQRLGKVFASPATWYRLVRLHQRRRPRRRVHPSSLRVGIRASVPYEIWHVDTTLLRLLDGTRACLHAVIDNFSRRILAWNVSATFDPSTTAKLLLDASKSLVDQRPTLLADGRVENAKKLVAFYVDEHNSRLPHSAFRGQTPDEMYFGTGGHIPDQLAAARKRHANRA